MSEFNPELYKCKAASMADDKTVICGFYYCNGADFIDVPNDGYEKKLQYPSTAHAINPYTLCRNTGIQLPDSSYLYEYDIVEYGNGMSGQKLLGIIEFDDWHKSFCIRTSANYSSKVEIRKYALMVVGNVMLSDDDMQKFQAYSDEAEEKTTTDIKVECRSTQRLNKIARQFLPK